MGGDGFGVGGGDEAPHLALLQLTGRFTTGAQTFDDFCFGLSGKQLLVSSKAMSLLD